jgi:hypothetical protein
MSTQNLIPTTETRRPTSWTGRVRATLHRFDRYTLEVMNPGHPYRVRADRSA